MDFNENTIGNKVMGPEFAEGFEVSSLQSSGDRNKELVLVKKEGNSFVVQLSGWWAANRFKLWVSGVQELDKVARDEATGWVTHVKGNVELPLTLDEEKLKNKMGAVLFCN
jgi:hypothetical protein